MKTNILDYFEEIIPAVGNRTAIVDGDQKFLFRDVYGLSRRMSLWLDHRNHGMIKQPIAVYMPKSYPTVVSDLAIMYSGNAYMNLDIKSPLPRVKAVLEIIQPKMILTLPQYAAALAGIFRAEDIVVYDEKKYMDKADESQEIERQLGQLIDTDPICIINTSGSTGTPKGVVLNHRSFIDFTEWALAAMPFRDDEVVGSLSPVIFDIYSYELCLMMSKGAALVLLPEMMAAFPAKMLQLMAAQKVSFIFWVPTIMVNIANMGLLARLPLPDLHVVWFAGEVFPTKQFNIWRRSLPGVMFVNMYGPIEITLDCTHYIIRRELHDDEPIPIGTAMKNTDVFLLDDQNHLCKQGETGELCVRGTSLALGYYNNPEKTAQAFVQNPLNPMYPELIYRTGDIAVVNDRNELVFKGRKDTLVKHSGYRIELGEIEHIIVNTLGLFSNACVVYDHVKNEIVLFYEAEEDTDIAAVKKKIGTVLPRYMIPTVYMRVKELPRNPNGKVDRLRLRQQLAVGR